MIFRCRRLVGGGDQILVAGESGGGCMTLLVIQAIVNAGLPVPAGAWVIAPMTRNDDARTAVVSTRQRVTRSNWEANVASHAPHSNAIISPAP